MKAMVPIMLRDRPPVPGRGPRAGTRDGAVLIIVVGLSMVLLGLSVTFMMRMRSEAQETQIVVAEAQARLMLHAGLMYLQEASRLGWGEETYGWTDIRDGGLGPRQSRNLKFRTDVLGNPTGTDVDGGIDGTFSTGAPADYNIPAPIWWKST